MNRYYLMNKDRILLEFEVEKTPLGENITEISSFCDQRPIGFTTISNWVENRNYAKHKEHFKKWLKEWQIDDTQGFLDITKCLGINDSFWVKRIDSELCWEKVNLYQNEFSDVAQKTAFETSLAGLKIDSTKLTSPEFTNEGTVPKCWTREDNKIYLYKTALSGAANRGLEPYSEHYASIIAGQIVSQKEESIQYDLLKFKEKLCSRCELFTDEKYGYVPFYKFVKTNENLNIGNVLKICSQMGYEKEFRQMILVDSIVMNQDRHLGNFGFIVDNDSLEIIKFAPIFDYNISFLCQALNEDLLNFKNYEEEYQIGHKLGGKFSEVGQAILTPELRNLIPQNIECTRNGKLSLPEDRFNKVLDILENNLHTITGHKYYYLSDQNKTMVSKKSLSERYLMKAEEIVMKIDFDNNEYVVFDEKLLPFSLRGAIKKVEPNMSVNEIVKINTDNYGKVIEFLSKRTISLDRRNAKKLLNAYKLSQSQDPITKAKIAITCKAVSMTDSYWINDDQLSFTWDKMNLRTNQLNKVISHIMLFGKSITATGLPHTPELTGKGTYAQAWVRKGNETYLFKRSTEGGRESELEVSISRILDCFNVDHVVYNLTKIKDKENEYLASKCKNIASEDLAMVSAEEVYSFCARNNIDFEHYILSIDSESIYKMNVIDYLISNSDRHLLNWGFYMDNSTGQLIKCHPLFDHNNAFDKEQMEDKDGGQNLVFSHLSKKEAAMIGMKKCSLKCIKPVTRNMFLTKEMYESFMERACELGLYQANKKNWKHHLGLEHFEKYIPASDVLSLSERLSNNQSMIDKHKQNVMEITYHKMDRE